MLVGRLAVQERLYAHHLGRGVHVALDADLGARVAHDLDIVCVCMYVCIYIYMYILIY